MREKNFLWGLRSLYRHVCGPRAWHSNAATGGDGGFVLKGGLSPVRGISSMDGPEPGAVVVSRGPGPRYDSTDGAMTGFGGVLRIVVLSARGDFLKVHCQGNSFPRQAGQRLSEGRAATKR